MYVCVRERDDDDDDYDEDDGVIKDVLSSCDFQLWLKIFLMLEY